MNFVFPAPPVASVPVLHSEQRFAVHRIYCVGRNYADHAREMGADVNRTQPTFFLKPADAVVTDGRDVPYPSATADLHHEVEMVVALGSGGRDIPLETALEHVFGYGVGLDLTRRDLQAAAKAKSLPWDVAKGFDASAPISALRAIGNGVHPQHATLSLLVNGEPRQNSDISEMIFNVAEIIHALSQLFELTAGDLIFTGTPAGVAALARGDVFEATLGGVASLQGRIV
ncbi:MAG: fumarylacetoacetate hydrolase family protein [Rhodanobacteraceae bacterium]|nr:fumarylacetoacetate hydrolase family protein [Rhodanobacteraceae bacterium]